MPAALDGRTDWRDRKSRTKRIGDNA